MAKVAQVTQVTRVCSACDFFNLDNVILTRARHLHFRETEDVAIFAFSFIQSKGVRLVVVAIGPDAQKQRYRNVLNEIGGNELIFVGDYEGIGAVVTDITGMICRKYLITTK